MGYAVMHMEKAKGSDSGMSSHIERKHNVENADSERTHLNRELIEFPDGIANRSQAIGHRLETAGLTRKIGSNQVRAVRILLTGSNHDMKRIEQAGQLDKWCVDNVLWLQKTFGKENTVSAVLHMDEATPHIHATVVPIVTGQRRKANEKKPGKKEYRKKNPNATRLCADDVMTRVKLKEYQNTYAEAMNKYGLQRGIEGSKARHITTQEFYRNAIAQQGRLQENIEELLKFEELKREAVEQLERQEQEARTQYQNIDALKQQAETELGVKQAELKEVKGQLKTEKLKSSAAEVGSNIIDGIGSMIGTSKVKIQQQEIDNLEKENQALRQDISKLNQTISRERGEREKVTVELKAELNKIDIWLPSAFHLVKWGEYCRSLGFTEQMAKDIVNMKPVRFSGEVYSESHLQYFKTERSEARLECDPDGSGRFTLLIDNTPLHQWFEQKHKQFLQKLGIEIPQRKQKNGVTL